MKILWFSNTPANSDECFDRKLSGTGGWLKALDKALQTKVELHIAFYHETQINNFKYENTFYYPIAKYKSLLGNIKEKAFNEVINTEHLHIYLNLIKQIEPDVIHIHGTENPFGCIINKLDVPVVVSIQGNITVYLHKFCSGLERKYLKIRNLTSLPAPHAFKNFKYSENKFKKMQQRENTNLKNCLNIIGRTDWDKRISRVLAPDSKYFHNDEILRDGFYESQWRTRYNKKFIIHTTNSDHFYKGFETICQALFELNNIGFHCEWRVAGINQNSLIVKIVKKIMRNKYPVNNLILLGSLTENDLIDRMLEADIYIMPSHIENSPNNLCEAMILGMPCIATYAGGTGSLLKNEYEGILIQDGDPWAMAGAILELKDNYEKAILMGKRARKKAMERHDAKKIVDDLIEIYCKLK